MAIQNYIPEPIQNCKYCGSQPEFIGEVVATCSNENCINRGLHNKSIVYSGRIKDAIDEWNFKNK